MNNKLVLVRDLTSLSEARYCSGMQVDFIAFEFNPNSKNYISDSLRNEILQWISGVKIVGTFEKGNLAEIRNCVETNVLGHFLFEIAQIDYLNSIVLDTKFLEIEDNFDSIKISEDVILISSIIPNHQNVLLGYDFNNPQKQPDAKGYAFRASKELRPGFNTYDELMDAFETIENL
jgi:phosphoribosylanthranilate isomerase